MILQTNMKKYNLKADHEAIKKQIKEWEIKLDKLVKDGVIESRDTTAGTVWYVFDELENISHEMMAVNL